VLIWGPGSIGLLTGAFATAAGADVHLAGSEPTSLSFARSLGYEHAWDADGLPDVPFDAMIDATYGADVPAVRSSWSSRAVGWC
jgi:threonine dehydrogenase-like Zn-dependent dehydrogenase